MVVGMASTSYQPASRFAGIVGKMDEMMKCFDTLALEVGVVLVSKWTSMRVSVRNEQTPWTTARSECVASSVIIVDESAFCCPKNKNNHLPLPLPSSTGAVRLLALLWSKWFHVGFSEAIQTTWQSHSINHNRMVCFSETKQPKGEIKPRKFGWLRWMFLSKWNLAQI